MVVVVEVVVDELVVVEMSLVEVVTMVEVVVVLLDGGLDVAVVVVSSSVTKTVVSRSCERNV